MCVAVPESRDTYEVHNLSLGIQELTSCASEKRQSNTESGRLADLCIRQRCNMFFFLGIIYFLLLKHKKVKNTKNI